MPGAPRDPSTPPHSVFISYASADRAAARALRDTLAAAGLEVWLDEDELAGGEAWDAKIRNQIRTCSYFMPVISTTTETRREGYFRREWRLAVERTLDFADDVMFLVPVVIDDTRDTGARVPEKFLTVQWLRVPGGQPTPDLQKLAERLAHGEAEQAPEAPPPIQAVRGRKARKPAAEPPPFPKFPAYPEHGNKGRFMYDLVVWAGHLFLAFWGHLPRWLRVLAAVILVFNVISWFKSTEAPAPKRARGDVAEEVKQMLEASGIRPGPKDRPPKGPAGALRSLVGGAVETAQSARPVTVIPFDGENDATREYAGDVFGTVCSELRDEDRQLWVMSTRSLRPTAPDAEIIARGVKSNSRFVLAGRAAAPAAGVPPVFTVRLFDTRGGALVWKESYELGQTEAGDAGTLIVEEIKKRLAEPVAPPAVTPPTPGK
jgi:hypothetical protein